MNSQIKALVIVLRTILRTNSLGDADAIMRRTVEAIYGRDAQIVVKDGGVFTLLVSNYKLTRKREWAALHKRYGKYFGPNESAAAHLLYGSEFDSHTAEFRIGRMVNGAFSVK